MWVAISCCAEIDETIKCLEVKNIHIYRRGEIPTRKGPQATRNIVPVIYPSDLDAEAERFLSRYFPAALQEPMEVPIKEIAENNLGLKVFTGHRLTHDFSIFGQICFFKTDVEVYDLFDISKDTINAQRGTIFVDAYTFWERNLGCANNTIAHEVFHWYRHRLYASIKHILHGEKIVPHRCPSDMTYPAENEEWTDEQRMEWQASTSGAFASYASLWILQNMSREQSTQNPQVYFPVHRKEWYFSCYSMLKQHGCLDCADILRCPKAADMIMRRVNCSLDQVADVLNAMIPFESLEMYLENINKCFEDTLCFQNTYLHAFVISDEDIVENVFKKQRQEIIHQALDELRPREKEVLISRYGLVGGEEKTLEEVGMPAGVRPVLLT